MGLAGDGNRGFARRFAVKTIRLGRELQGMVSNSARRIQTIQSGRLWLISLGSSVENHTWVPNVGQLFEDIDRGWKRLDFEALLYFSHGSLAKKIVSVKFARLKFVYAPWYYKYLRVGVNQRIYSVCY